MQSVDVSFDRATAGAGGPTPALTLRDYNGREWRIRSELPGMRSTMHSIVAFTDDGSIAGEIRWFKKGGEIALVWVVPHLQRRRIATILFAEALRRQPDLHHSEELSADARAWIASLEARQLAYAG